MLYLHVLFLSCRSIADEEKSNLRVGFVDLLQMLIEKNDSCEFTLALGADTFIDLSRFKWKRSRDIIQMLGGRIVVFQRKGAVGVDDIILKERIDHMSREFAESLPDLKCSIRLVELSTLSDISSTAMRSTCDEGVLSSALDSNVLSYIKDKKLFAFSEECIK